MAKKAYVGVDDVARNVKNIYVGVNGVARKVVKGYVGVNGVARLFWDGGGSSATKLWAYWTSIKGGNSDGSATFLFPSHPSDLYYPYRIIKANDKIAYYAVIKVRFNGNIRYRPLFVSRDEDAVAFYEGGVRTTSVVYESTGNFVGVRNYTWYYSSSTGGTFYSEPPQDENLLLNNKIYDWDTPEFGKENEQPSKDLLDMVYARSFDKEYQRGQTYTFDLSEVTDKYLSTKKLLGMWLTIFINRYGTHGGYTYVSDHAQSIIDTICNGSTSMLMRCKGLYTYITLESSNVYIQSYGYDRNTTTMTVYITDTHLAIDNWYDGNITSGSVSVGNTRFRVNNSGIYDVQSGTGSSNALSFGCVDTMGSYTLQPTAFVSNLGMADVFG